MTDEEEDANPKKADYEDCQYWRRLRSGCRGSAELERTIGVSDTTANEEEDDEQRERGDLGLGYI